MIGSDSVNLRIPETTLLIERVEGIVNTFRSISVGTFAGEFGTMLRLGKVMCVARNSLTICGAGLIFIHHFDELLGRVFLRQERVEFGDDVGAKPSCNDPRSARTTVDEHHEMQFMKLRSSAMSQLPTRGAQPQTRLQCRRQLLRWRWSLAGAVVEAWRVAPFMPPAR